MLQVAYQTMPKGGPHMQEMQPLRLRPSFIFVLPIRYKRMLGPKPFRIGRHRFEYDGEPNASADAKPPLQAKEETQGDWQVRQGKGSQACGKAVEGG